MIITTVKGAKFDTEKPARSNVVTILDGRGRKSLDDLKLTGNTSVEKVFMEDVTMLEVEHSFGKDYVNEDYVWQ